MPIRGMTDKPDPLRGMVRLGQLFKGGPKPETGNAPGPELDHFRVEFPTDSPARKTLAEKVLWPAWDKLYTRTPAIIGGVYFLDDSVDDAFPTWMQTWAKGKLVRRCDGDQQLQWLRSDNTVSIDPIPCAKNGTGCACKQEGLLRFILPELTRETGLVGYMTLRTHGKVDIGTMHSVLSGTKQMFGTIRSVPFVLSREPRDFQITTFDKSGTARQQRVRKYLVQLAVDQEFMREQAPRLFKITTGQAENLASLAAPASDQLQVTEDGEIVDNIPF